MEQSTEQFAKLATALAKAQGQFPPIPKNRKAIIRPRDQAKQPYEFRYADLEGILSAIRKPLADSGLSIVQIIQDQKLTTMLLHESGEKITSSFSIPDSLVYQDLKAYGAIISYLRRYAVQTLVCVASDDDLDQDGEEAGEPDQPQQQGTRQQGARQQQPRQTQQQQPQGKPVYPQDRFDKKFSEEWKANLESGTHKAQDIITFLSSKYELTEEQTKDLRDAEKKEHGE